MSKHPNTDDPASLVGAGVIWSFWEGQPPSVVLRCFESIRIHNTERPFIVVSRATLGKFLDDASDFPLFRGQPGTPDDFSKVQYLADWVRLTLLEKYGGIWLDASVICTSSVDRWIAEVDAIVYDSDEEEKQKEIAPESGNKINIIHMFPMHANGNIHGNWAMAALVPGNPVIQAWRREMNDVFDEIGPGGVPTEYIDRILTEMPNVRERWNNPEAPPLPYLWVYLTLQVVLDHHPELHSHIVLHSCIDGPMFRRYQYNIVHGIQDAVTLSQRTADDLASKPLQLDGPDRWFIKLVGTDREPVQNHLDSKTYHEGSALGKLSQLRARTVVYGSNMRTIANLDRVRAAVHLIVSTRAFGGDAAPSDGDSSQIPDTNLRASKRQSVLMDFKFEDSSLAEEDDRPQKRDSILVGFHFDAPTQAPTKRESICLDFFMDEDDLEEDEVGPPADADPSLRRESIYADLPTGVSPSMVTIL